MSNLSKNELKKQRLKEDVDTRALKDAEALWQILRQYFLVNPKDANSIVANLNIKVCFCEESQDLLKYARNRVFIVHGSGAKCLLLSTKKIRYPKETSTFLQQLAIDNGFTVFTQGYSEYLHFDSLFDYNMGHIYGEWISFTSPK